MIPGNNETKATKRIDVDLNHKRKEQPPKSLPLVPGAVIRREVSPFLSSSKQKVSASALAILARLCVPFYALTKEELNKQALVEFQRAALADDREAVIAILENATLQRLRYLLTTNPADVGIPEIESSTPDTSTWQRLASKLIFPMVQYLGYEISELIFLCFEQHKELREELLKQVVLRELSEPEEKTMQNFYKETLCYPYIETLIKDTTLEVPWELNPATGLYEGEILKASKETWEIIHAFRKKLFPEQAIDLEKLDTPENLGAPGSYPHMEQLCKAFVGAYEEKFKDFKNWDQRSAYSIGFMAPIFTLLGPGDGKKFCHSLNGWVNGCSVYFMAAPKDNQYKISNQHNLYVYPKGFYFIENDPKPKNLTGVKLPEPSEFTATPIKLRECVDAKLVNAVLSITSEQKHTVSSGRILSKNATACRLPDGRSFMRDSSEFRSGHGVNFVVSIFGGAAGVEACGGWGRAGARGWLAVGGRGVIDKLFQAKASVSGELIRRAEGRAQVGYVVHTPTQMKHPSAERRCIIS